MPNTTAIILETRTPRKDGTCPVKLRVCIDRKSRYYNLDKYLTIAEFEKVTTARPKEPYKQIKWFLDEKEKKAKQILETLPEKRFDLFKQQFTTQSTSLDFHHYYQAIINDKIKNGLISTAECYQCALNSLENLMGLSNLNFRDITPGWLKSYHNRMIEQKKSITSIKIYLGTLKTVLLKAIEDGVLNKNDFPFGKKKYIIPTSENNKRPLEKSEIRMIADYAGDPLTEYYRDFFLLSYFLSGLNFADLLTAKWSQFNGDELEVLRKKTANTTRIQTKILLVVNQQARQLIDKHGNKGGIFIFDIINPKDDPATARRKKKNFGRAVNQALVRISKATGLNKHLSLMFARHSAASHSLAAGATIADISQALGHSDLKTTSNYISSLSSGKRKIAESLEI